MYVYTFVLYVYVCIRTHTAICVHHSSGGTTRMPVITSSTFLYCTCVVDTVSVVCVCMYSTYVCTCLCGLTMHTVLAHVCMRVCVWRGGGVHGCTYVYVCAIVLTVNLVPCSGEAHIHRSFG